MGIADMLNQLSIGYDSEEGISTITKVMEFITNAAYLASACLAAEKGASPIYSEDEYMRLDQITPFWRVVKPDSNLAHKLTCGIDFLIENQIRENISL